MLGAPVDVPVLTAEGRELVCELFIRVDHADNGETVFVAELREARTIT